MDRFLFPLLIGYLMDIVLGDPYWLPHPVCGMGWFINQNEKIIRTIFPKTPKGEKVGGLILVITVLLTTLGVAMGILYIALRIDAALAFVIQCIMCWQCIAQKSLKTESMKVYSRLQREDLEGARMAVSRIVGRDTQNLSLEGVAKATVETVAENTSDGVIAPLIYMAIGGGVMGYAYKAINTMDSMIAYKNDRYIHFGYFAAKLDDVANFAPARISGVLMVISAFLMGMNGKNAWRVFKRDRLNHASPNSAQTEAACAGALEIQLAGDAWYFGKLYKKKIIGDSYKKVEAEDVLRANRLMDGAVMLMMLEIVILYLIF